MDFTFSEDQLLFQESVRSFLVNENTPEAIRQLWETESGRSDALWAQLAEMGLTGMTVPEEHGGLGMSELDFVLLAQEAGYVALSEPLVNSVLVAAPLLAECGNDVQRAALQLADAAQVRFLTEIVHDFRQFVDEIWRF